MARLGIRHRPPYTCRHTYATTALAAGVARGYIASQMGHVNTKMLHEEYSKWIKGADKGVQRAALNAAMGGTSVLKNGGEKGRIRLA
jgi:integrase